MFTWLEFVGLTLEADIFLILVLGVGEGQFLLFLFPNKICAVNFKYLSSHPGIAHTIVLIIQCGVRVIRGKPLMSPLACTLLETDEVFFLLLLNIPGSLPAGFGGTLLSLPPISL